MIRRNDRKENLFFNLVSKVQESSIDSTIYQGI